MASDRAPRDERPRLLVVDDEEGLLDVFSEFLSPEDYALDLARTGNEAVEKIEAGEYDLIVTDLNLPGPDGLVVLRTAREMAYHPEVIVLTGTASTMTAIEALRQGAYDYVLKPFDLFEMDQTMRRALERRRLSAENREFIRSLQRANKELETNQEELRLHQERLRSEVEAATARMRTLYEVGKEISASLHLDRTLSLILDRSLALTGGTRGALFLRSEADGRMETRASSGMDDGNGGWDEADGVLESLKARVVRTAAPVAERVEIPGLGAQSALLVPLLQEGTVAGSVAVLRPDGETFSLDDSELLVSLAAQASIAIHNATAYGRVRELERLKSEFVAVVSHEVRTPLTAIKGSLEILADGTHFPVDQPSGELMQICQASVVRLEALINDILDFSKLESSRLSARLVPIRLPGVIENAISQIRRQAERKQIQIGVHLDQSLPGLRADELRISQVLSNLISNAIKFSPEGTEIRVAAHASEGGVTVEVRDQGIGIAREDLPKIFRPFRQLDSSSTRMAGGTGLGLVISKGIIEEHGGRIWVESEPGTGSRFSFWIPGDTVQGSECDEMAYNEERDEMAYHEAVGDQGSPERTRKHPRLAGSDANGDMVSP